jgi:hypothetical protein
MEQESISIAWCDNGMVDGKFMQGVCDVMLKSGLEFKSTLRTAGNQIARQRETLINYWFSETDTEWLLWVDSDVIISPEKFKLLWDSRDAEKHPIITGVYFTTDTPEEPLMIPMPTVFNFTDNKDGKFGLKRVHPMPENKLIQVGAAGMGFVLMHRNVVKKIKEALPPDSPMFMEMGRGTKFIGEDIYFFALCDKVDIPVYCHTGATVPHMKRFSFDEHYYKAFFGGVEKQSNIILPKRK